MADVGPASLDSKHSEKDKQEKLREEAQYEKERGNSFVKQEKWSEAIVCYSRAIELVKDDAIYYANRGLCYLKKDSLHQAEKDCTEALKLDPTYVKALQRRATARERLGSLRAASSDLNEVLKLEPHNAAAKRQLEAIKTRMGTKGAKSKSSPSSTPTIEVQPITKTAQPKVVELETTEPTPLEKWRDGVGENITVIKPVKKPPHLRSKRALKHITIQEIPFGCNKPKSVTKIDLDSLAQGDSNNNSDSAKPNLSPKGDGDKIDIPVEKMIAPVNSVQFMNEWKYLKNSPEARSHYLSIIDPSAIPSIFANALESDVLSQVLHTLHEHREQLARAARYLHALTRVKRFSALAMFLSDADKEVVNKLLVHCKTKEGLPDDEIDELKKKFEL
ncbi:RNA polymerase II-associated protein 3-like isoform X2 [Zerene cesonia]|nr:RNA polymerase II-associated protein 3-like isoform X2 [Zerene cesonia]